MMLPGRHPPSTAEAGFSLVELLVAMLVSTLVATGIVMNLDFTRAAASDPAGTLTQAAARLRQDAVTQGRILALQADEGALHRLIWKAGEWTADPHTRPVTLEGLRNAARSRGDVPSLVASPTGILEGAGFLVDTPSATLRLVIARDGTRLERAG